MHFKILCSGSQGNCSIICSKTTKIVIDCGGGIRYLKQAFEQVGVDYQQVDALLLTHAHSDHCKQVKMFERVPVYSPFAIGAIYNERIIMPLQTFKVGDLTILPLPLSHDTGICVGYIITDNEETLVQVTDTGYLSNSNLQLIKGADYYIFESNHDVEMLMATNRPEHLKKRILSDLGHMSNEYAASMLCECINSNTKQVILAHISQEANDYELAYYTTLNALVNRKLYRQGLKLKAIKQFEIYESEQNV